MRPPVLFIPTPESQQATEYEKNLERGEVWMEHGLKPYEGPFPHLDLMKTWYCPECRLELPMRLSQDKLTIHCTNPAYVSSEGPCEYTYANEEGRARTGTFLSSGYQLPLSRQELIEGWIESKQQCIKNTKKRIKQSKQGIKNLEQEIVGLKARL